MESALAQHSQVLSLLPAPEDLLAGSESVHVVAKAWWERWCSYAKGGEAPGPIDNLPLYELYVKEEGMRSAALHRDLCRDIDYLYVTTLIWGKLVSWYGGGPETELFVSQGSVDWAPVPLGVQTNLDTHFFLVSLCISLLKLKKFFCAKLQLPEAKYELTRGGKCLDSAASLSCSGVSAYMVFLLRERKIQIDLPPVYEDQGSDPIEGPTFELEDLPLLAPVRTDREEVQLRIQTAASLPKTTLQIKVIRSTRKHLADLYEDFSVT